MTLFLFVAVSAQTVEKKAEEIKCPVTGEKADPKITTEYKGVTFSFCCEGCKEKFLKDPAQYVHECFQCPKCAGECAEKAGKCPKCGAEMKAKVMAKNCCEKHAVMYVCPMCKDVKSDKPGKCPKCKMELKKKEGCADPNCAGHKKAEEKKEEPTAAVNAEKKDKACGGCAVADKCAGKEKKETKK